MSQGGPQSVRSSAPSPNGGAMDVATLREQAGDLPREPGVYQFLDGDRVLYVGKAVGLRDRVRSYADPRSERIRQMVARADDVDTAVTDTESQALLLEANLIKRHRPKYNVRLKDDKSYPLVELTDHGAPQIRITRDPDSGSTVFGPFTDKGRVETVLKAVRQTYGIRGCSDHKYANRATASTSARYSSASISPVQGAVQSPMSWSRHGRSRLAYLWSEQPRIP